MKASAVKNRPMGRHSTIEKEYLKEVVEGERRAQRALRVISHQMELIEKLSSEGLKCSTKEEKLNPNAQTSDHDRSSGHTLNSPKEPIAMPKSLILKLDSLDERVEHLKSEQDSVLEFLSEVTQWKAAVEGAILDINASVNDAINNDKEAGPIPTDTSPECPTDAINSTRKKMWRTARQYFTADQAHFLLSLTPET